MFKPLVMIACVCFTAWGLFGCESVQVVDTEGKSYIGRETKLDVDELLTWPAYGIGTVEGFRNRAVIIREVAGSKGVMVVSPNSFSENLIIRYQAMTLTAGTVLVTIHSASGAEGADLPVLPENYDGAIRPWLGSNPGYFFAFHNAAHLRYPFVNRAGDGQFSLLHEADQYYMTLGRWHDVEVGRWDDQVWLSIDGQRVLDVTDDAPIPSGAIALRIRGTGPEQASVMIRDLMLIAD